MILDRQIVSATLGLALVVMTMLKLAIFTLVSSCIYGGYIVYVCGACH